MAKGDRTRLIMAGGLGVVLMIALAAAITLLKPGGADDKSQSSWLAKCQSLPSSGPSRSKQILCIAEATDKKIGAGQSPTAVLATLQKEVDRMGPEPLSACHPAMHLSGARYAKQKKITLANLLRYLPQSDSTQCAAGFTHGIISVLGVTPQNAATVLKETCSKEDSRAQQYACIHGVGHGVRHTLGDPAQSLKVCATIQGPAASDCAQGVYHDYFMAIPGSRNPKAPQGNKVTIEQLDAGTDIRRDQADRRQSNAVDQACLDQPKRFLKECWYRLTQGPGIPIVITQPADIQYACGGLPAAQYRACIGGMGVSRVGNKQLIPTCAVLDKGQRGEGTACLSSLDLKAVGWSPAFRQGEEPIDPESYRAKAIPELLGQCQQYIERQSLKKYCVTQVAKLSVRITPGKVGLSRAENVCPAAKGKLRKTCRQAVREIYQDMQKPVI